MNKEKKSRVNEKKTNVLYHEIERHLETPSRTAVNRTVAQVY